MTCSKSLISDLEERNLAQISIKHDEARILFTLLSNTVGSYPEFCRGIGDYLSHHHNVCGGGSLSASEAVGRAKELLENEYGRRGGNIISAYNDAHEGTNGGMRIVLDTIAESLKAEFLRRYIREVFDRHVTPNSWNQKVEIIRDFISNCGEHLSSSIHRDQPERYAQNYVELIHSYVTALQKTSGIFRRL